MKKQFENQEEVPRTEIIGRRIMLQEIQPTDNLSKLLEWRNSAEFQEKCLSFKSILTPERLIAEIRKGYQTDRHAHFIAYDKNGNAVGTNWIYNYNIKNKVAYTTTYVASEYRKFKYFGIEMFLLACQYIFNTLECRKVYSEVHSDNNESKILFEKLGLALEANLKNHNIVSEGVFSDLLIYALYKEQFQESDFVKRILFEDTRYN